MGWNFNLRKTFWWGVDQVTDAAGSIMTTAGTTASVLGGVGLALSQGLNKNFSAAYYGDVVAAGGLEVNGTLKGTDFSINYTLPIEVSGEKDGQFLYNITEYIDPSLVLLMSTLTTGAGILFTCAGNALKQWQQYRYDARVMQKYYCNPLSYPSPKEIALNFAGSACAAMSMTMFSHMITSTVWYHSDLLKSLNLTYPFTSDHGVNSTYYQGPVNKGVLPINEALAPQTVPIDIPFLGQQTLLLKMAAHGLANYSYAVGLFPKKDGPTPIPPVVTQVASATVASITFLLQNSFFRQCMERRDCRMNEANTYMRVQDDCVRPINS
jgi:hypothetical protein